MSESIKINEDTRTGSELAVIGMAGRFPGARDIHEFWNNLENGVESVSFYSDEELKELGISSELLDNPNFVKSQGGALQDKELFDASFFDYTPKEAEIMDPQMRIFHECAWEALEDAGYDARNYRGLIGLYAGASSNFYWQGIAFLSGKRDELGFMASNQLSDKDYLSTRIAYKLNLKGPAFIVQTACSTSLVAIHLACQGLLNGECVIALAGGVSVSSGKANGYLYQEGMILSPDGHCRAFDENARGTIGGEGVGIVVLKALEDALRDRDHILAVIKGTAINNDGVRKVGYTAPSIEGQAQVIGLAQHLAEVDPTSISYIEAHGTGTMLGDPVEIEGLKMAFNTHKKGFCAIGSVKTNVGHLDAAAGVTGFIKTVLALKHKQLPPSLHFENPNSKIDLENSPFYVVTKLTQWKNDDYPLRAGVSSFGIGGTNAHVVLEEFSQGTRGLAPFPNAHPSRKYQLILLSAKTLSALDKMTINLADYLKKNSCINMADAAYTLQVGRKPFKYRKMSVCSGMAEAVDALSSTDQAKVRSFITGIDNRPVIFMFPGQGSQYVNMGLELYEKESFFRQELDRCFEILKPIMGYDIKEILYPSSAASVASAMEMNQTEVVQPILFAFEYALAKLLINWGIEPGVMIGHSIGEYTAACLSGVFSLEDALNLVALRGRLMQQIPTGAMLSVTLGEEELCPLIKDKEISLAAVNGLSRCVVSGTDEAIKGFKKELESKGCDTRLLHTSHAFHSAMMDPVLTEFEKAIHDKQVRLNKPGIPFISNITGTWITSDQAAEPGYWALHLRKTVRFADGIGELFKKDNAVFLEIGPGQALSTLIRQYPHKSETAVQHPLVINLVRHPQENISDLFYLLEKIGYLWLYGVNIDWTEFYREEKRSRIPLPTYPFQRQTCWIDGDFSDISLEKLSQKLLAVEKPGIADWFYIPSWKKTTPPALLTPGNSINSKKNWLIFVDDHGIGKKIGKRYRENDHDVAYVMKKEKFSCINDSEYTINPQQPDHYHKLVKQLKLKNKKPTMIVHCWNLIPDVDNKPGIEIFNHFQDHGFYSLLFLIQALDKHELAFIDQEDMIEFLQIIVITNGIKSVTGKEKIYPEKSTILGLCKTIPLEYRNIKCRCIDIVINGTEPWKDNELVDQIIDELSYESSDNDSLVAYRENSRWVNYFEPITLVPYNGRPRNLKERGVYLITGGLGRDSLIRAKYLAQTVKARLILIGRSKFPARENWDRWLEDHPKEDQTCKKIEKLLELEALGAEILVISADVANEKDMKTVMDRLDKRFGRLDGVIHAAGITDIESSVLIPKLGRTETELHFKPKVYGLYILEKLLRGRPLDFCMLTSSIASFTGGAGLSAYTAASIFMDMFAHKHNRKESVNWMSLNWMGTAPEETTEAFHLLLNQGPIPQIGVSKYDLPWIIKVRSGTRFKQKEVDAGQRKLSEKYKSPHLMNNYIAPQNETERKLGQIWENLFGIETLGIHDDFFELGGDSLKAITVIARIHRTLNVELTLAEFFNHPTIEKLSGYINDIGSEPGVRFTSIGVVEKKEYYPLFSAQKRLYFLHQLEPESTGYHISLVVSLEGSLDPGKLENCFRKSINRHESLRTYYMVIHDEPVQRVHDQVVFEIEYYKTGNRQEAIVNKDELMPDSYIKNFIRPFDLSVAPLLRVGLIKIGEKNHVLIVDMHHITTDGISMEILYREFMEVYAGKELPQIKLQYKDYVLWQCIERKKGALSEQEDYWRRQFAGEIPVLNLPTDYPRPAVQSVEGGSISFQIQEHEVTALNQLALSQGTSLYMVLLTLYTIFLAKITGLQDIVVGTPHAGRHHADLQQIIGMFVNTLGIRNYPDGEKIFIEFLQEVKEIILAAFENQDYPFEDLVEAVSVTRDLGHNPLFDVMFALQNMERTGFEIPGIKFMPYDYKRSTSTFDLTFFGVELENSLQFTFEYCTKLFKTETIERFTHYFRKIIFSVIKDPGQKIFEIDIIPGPEKQLLLYEFNDTAAWYPGDKTLLELFADQVEQAPDKTAVVEDYCQLTYGDLNRSANRMARILQSGGVTVNTLVGLMLHRSLEIVTSILGVLKAGGAYLPLDPLQPWERKKYLIKESSVNTLIIQKDIKESHQDLKDCFSRGNVLVASDMVKQVDTSNPDIKIKPVDLAYAVYTSGTTGWPKAVLVNHGGIVNYTSWRLKTYDLTSTDVTLQMLPYYLDAFGSNFYSSLLSGGTLVMIPDSKKLDPDYIRTSIIKCIVTNISVASPMYRIILTGTKAGELKHLRFVVLAGETTSVNLIKKGKKIAPSTALVNEYGPTETTVTAAGFWGMNELNRNVIGQPIFNTHIYILDPSLKSVPLKVSGELCISGPGVARGYLNKPELTDEKFTLNPLQKGERIYHTGDIARWQPDGNIEIIGRFDHQVKVRGFRIELGEIECQLEAHDEIKEAVVLAIERKNREKYLCAYIVVINKRNNFPVSQLREYLSQRLPGYMIPSSFVLLEKIPLTSNGKTDRRALPEPDQVKGLNAYTGPRDETEEKLSRIWTETLEIERERVGIDDNFFHLGGNSLKAAVAAAKIHKELKVKLPLVEIFKTPTIRGLSRYIKGVVRNEYLSIRPVEKKEFYILSSAQKRLYISHQLEMGNCLYNIPVVLTLKGDLDRGKFEQIFSKLIERHESLRTSFHIVNEKAVQRIHEKVDFKIEYQDFQTKSQSQFTSIENSVRSFVRVFDLTEAPLLRVGLIRQAQRKWVLMFDMHHIITDGTSMGIFINEFAALFRDEVLPTLRIHYKDFSQWHNKRLETEEVKAQEEYWLNRFKGKIPVLSLPTTGSGLTNTIFEEESIGFKIGKELVDKIRRFILEKETTLFMVLLASFNILLSKYSGQEDIVVGTSITGRNHADLQNVIGMFVNMLSLRNLTHHDKKFREFVEEVKENALKAYENQDYQFDELVTKLKLTRKFHINPLFNVVFVLHNEIQAEQNREEIVIPGLEMNMQKNYHHLSMFDLILDAVETKNEISFKFHCRSQHIKEGMLIRMSCHLVNIITAAINNPEVRLLDIEMLNRGEKNRLMKKIKTSSDTLTRNKAASKQKDSGDLQASFDF